MSKVRQSGFVEGLEQCVRGFDALSEAGQQKVLIDLARFGLEPMLATAIQLAPDDPKTPPPDDLRGSLAIGMQRTGRKNAPKHPNAVEMFMGPRRGGYPQAIPQEMGTVHHPPHPYMRPSFLQHAPGTAARIGQRWWPIIEKIAAREARQAAKARRR